MVTRPPLVERDYTKGNSATLHARMSARLAKCFCVPGVTHAHSELRKPLSALAIEDIHSDTVDHAVCLKNRTTGGFRG